MGNDLVVYSLRLANKLAGSGCPIKAIGINKNNPKYNVYYFEDTAAAQQIINDFKKNPYK